MDYHWWRPLLFAHFILGIYVLLQDIWLSDKLPDLNSSFLENLLQLPTQLLILQVHLLILQVHLLILQFILYSSDDNIHMMYCNGSNGPAAEHSGERGWVILQTPLGKGSVHDSGVNHCSPQWPTINSIHPSLERDTIKSAFSIFAVTAVL